MRHDVSPVPGAAGADRIGIGGGVRLRSRCTIRRDGRPSGYASSYKRHVRCATANKIPLLLSARLQ
ncbi:hypothetical protein I35_6100 [Burkholderia cenocepacia H111]|nr:uncharacterized protein BCN122_II2573 [Burkholderia cenocepacia]CDN63936.1 hypothetical protein I35_6100 [Burkholderia cenocepacia H111]